MWKHLMAIAAGGACGSLMRFAVATMVQRTAGGYFPWGTLTVNALGCFLFGWCATLAERRMLGSEDMRALILVGFLGAFTTFSTYAYDTTRLALSQDGLWWSAFINLLVQNALGIACVLGGAALAQKG